MGQPLRRLPPAETLSYLLLTMTAISGEFPVSQVRRLPGGAAYMLSVVTALKRDGLLKTYSRDSLRGLRLSKQAKRLLLADRPEWFSPCLTGRAEPNVLKSEISRRLRLHRMAEVMVTMTNAGVPSLPWEKPCFSSKDILQAFPPAYPVYYTSRELKEIGPQGTKIKSSRATGILLTDGGIFVVYNTGASQMKWEYKAELRLKAMLQIEFLREVPAEMCISGILFGTDMEQVFTAMDEGGKHNYFVLDGNFDHFYYLTNDHRGEVLLRLLYDSDLKMTLDQILSENLYACRPGWLVENDALDESGAPVLYGYTCDMPRIRRFDTALELHEMEGTLICFDFQETVLRRVCGHRVAFQSIDFEQYERSVLHIQEETD